MCHVGHLPRGMIFVKYIYIYKMCVLVFPTIFVRNISHSKKIQWDTITLHRSSCRVLIILVRFYSILNFLNTQNFTKIRPLEAELIHADGQMDRHTDPDRRTDRHAQASSRFSQIITTEQDAFVPYNQHTDRARRFPLHQTFDSSFLLKKKKGSLDSLFETQSLNQA